MVKNPPSSAGDIRDGVGSLGQEDRLEEGMATRTSILAWRTPWRKEPGGYWPSGHRVGDDWWLSTHACISRNSSLSLPGARVNSWASHVHKGYILVPVVMSFMCLMRVWGVHEGGSPFLFYFIVLSAGCTACGILVPWLEVEPGPWKWKS